MASIATSCSPSKIVTGPAAQALGSPYMIGNAGDAIIIEAERATATVKGVKIRIPR